MGYVRKNRIGQWSGDLEIVSLYGKDNNCQLVWLAVCHRQLGDRICLNEQKVLTSRIGDAVCCRACSFRDRKTGKRRYAWTPAMDRMITAIHQKRAEKRTSALPSYKQYGIKLGRPKHAVIARARELGLIAEQREPPYSSLELTIMNRGAWKTPLMLYRELSRRGFKRSLTSVTLKRKRLRLHARREWLNARELAEVLGLDSHKITEWTTAGLIKFNWRQFEPENENGHNNGNDSGGANRKGEYVFTPEEIRAFLLKHGAQQIDLRKVDQVWFFDIISTLAR